LDQDGGFGIYPGTQVRLSCGGHWRRTIVGYETNFNNYGPVRIKNRTPIKGFYPASAWGNPGGGYADVMTGGQSAFKDLMEDWEQEI